MEIDLATKTIGRLRQTQRAKHFLDRLIIWGALFLSLVLIIIAGLNLAVSQDNGRLNQKVQSATKEIAAQSKIESQQVYLSSKLQSFAGLVKTHELHQAIAETVFSLIPNGTTLKGFAVEETGMINLSGSVPNWSLLSQLLENLKNPPPGYLQIKDSKIKQINFSADGAVSFSVDLMINI